MRHDMERVDGGEEAVGGVVLAGTVVVEPQAVHPIQFLAVIAKCNSIFFHRFNTETCPFKSTYKRI